MFVSCECRELSGTGLCDGLITRPEESYRAWRVELSVIVKPRQRRDPGPLRNLAPIEKENIYV
jgi:hypothetical protein